MADMTIPHNAFATIIDAAELLENWQLAKQGQPLKRIAPLE